MKTGKIKNLNNLDSFYNFLSNRELKSSGIEAQTKHVMNMNAYCTQITDNRTHITCSHTANKRIDIENI